MADKPLTIREMTKDEASRYRSVGKFYAYPDQSDEMQKEIIGKDEGELKSKHRKRKKKDVESATNEEESLQTTDNSKRLRIHKSV